MTSLKKYFLLLMFAAVLFFSGFPVSAQNTESLPRVAVAPLEMSDPDNIQLNIISERVRETSVLILRYLDDYEFQRDVLTRPGDYDNASLLEYCEANLLDSLVYGKTYQREDGSFIIEMSVYSREREETTLTRIEEADTALDIFEAADNITYSLIEGFSGQRISFGRITINISGPEGAFIPVLDGEEYPAGTRVFDRVLSGQRRLELYQVRMLGEVKVYDEVLEVPEGETVRAEPGLPYLMAEEEELINEQAEIIKRYGETAVEKPRERPRVADAYNRIDALLINTDYNIELAELRAAYRAEKAEWEALLAAADAQPAGKREFVVGARGGGAFGRVYDREGWEDDNKLLYYDGELLSLDNFNGFPSQADFPEPFWGVFAELQLYRNLYLQVEYNHKCVVFNRYFDEVLGETNFHEFWYHQIPVLFKFKHKTRAGNFSILAGMAYVITDSSRSAGFMVEEPESIYVTNSEQIENTVSPVAGVEYSYNFGRHVLYAGYRFTGYSLLGYEYNNPDEDIFFESQPVALDTEITLGYGYNFGGTGDIKEKEKKGRWLYPAGAGIIFENTISKYRGGGFALASALYGFTDTIYAGITSLLPTAPLTGIPIPLPALAWTRDPERFIHKISGLIVPAGGAVTYSFAFRRYKVGYLALFGDGVSRLLPGLYLGYYF